MNHVFEKNSFHIVIVLGSPFLNHQKAVTAFFLKIVFTDLIVNNFEKINILNKPQTRYFQKNRVLFQCSNEFSGLEMLIVFAFP